jgi:hypothetical protein
MNLPLLFNCTLALLYGVFFVNSVSPYWFNPLYTTDDALQQLFPLYDVIDPEIFRGDIINLSMKGYLAPLHLWISEFITIFTRDPNMTGHVVMLFQVIPTLIFLFLAVRRFSSNTTAFFAVFWYLHTRNLMQRMTLGLPRGWGGLIITAFIYFLASKNHTAILFTILLGILLNPPAAFLVAFCYGLYLLIEAAILFYKNREYYRPFFIYLILSPLFVVAALWSVARPAEIGKMVSLEEASKMPAFSRHGGRFTFLPFKAPLEEFNTVGSQAFVNKWHEPNPLLKKNAFFIALTILAFFLLLGRKYDTTIIPKELMIFLFSVFSVYFASRLFAFRLYVPDRHLQFPLNTFWIMAFSIALYNIYRESPKRLLLSYTFLATLLFALGGSGLEGTANFNTKTDLHGSLFSWIRSNTPKTAMIAGHPSHLDGVQLFGMRKGYITTETAHPFYDNYYKLVVTRLKNLFSAYYATDAQQFLNILNSEGINFFVFRKADFNDRALKNASYTQPLKRYIQKLVAGKHLEEFFATQIRSSANSYHSAIVYEDENCLIVDRDRLIQLLTL